MNDPLIPDEDSGSEALPFASAWDRYVADHLPQQRWPGDDWGNEELWNRWFQHLFGDLDVQGWTRAVEIGQGTGKYTRRVLEAGCREVLACDVSRRFLDLCRARQADLVGAGRLHLRSIDERDPDAVVTRCDELGWTGTVDCLFSIDTMVHLPLTAVACQLLNATLYLRAGGYVVLTFADATTDAGLQKLVTDMSRTLQHQGDPTTGCFHWISPELLRSVASRLGYEVVRASPDPEHQRDGHFIARFTDPHAAKRVRALRQP